MSKQAQSNKFLSGIADFLGPQLVTRDVEFNGKKQAFHLRILTGDQSEALFNREGDEAKSNKRFRARVIAGVVCDADGANVMTVEEAGTLPNLFQNALVEACLDVNGVSNKAKEEAGNAPLAPSASGGQSSSELDGSLGS